MIAASEKTRRMRIPVVEGLFIETAEGPRLVGSRCSCGACYFPKASTCNNPDCQGRKTVDYLLGPLGKLWSFTVQHYPPPAPFKADEPFTPYAIGLVEFPEGIRVLGQMSVKDVGSVKIGEPVRLIIERLYMDANGNEVVTWKFRPSVE